MMRPQGITTTTRMLANDGIVEVDRASENLVKSGKGFGFPPVGGNRRESMPVMAPRQNPEQQYGTRTCWKRVNAGD